MGMSIDIHWYNYQELINRLQKRGANKIVLLNKILNKCGLHLGESYIIVNNELTDGYSPYYNVSSLIDSAFNLENSFDDFCGHGKWCDCYVDKYEIADELGFKIKEDEE